MYYRPRVDDVDTFWQPKDMLEKSGNVSDINLM